MSATVRPILLLVALLALAGCGPSVQPFGPNDQTPRIEDGIYHTADGTPLPLQIWLAHGRPKAVIVALHGFNMYSGHFQDAGPWWAEHDITTYAYDQRGFGGAPDRGIWGGTKAMAHDARDFVDLVHARHPGVPVYLLGSSMGAAVAIAALAMPHPPRVDGAVLVSPAVWGGDALPPLYRFTSWLLAYIMPWNHATGSNLGIRPSDNEAMLIANGRDKYNIFETRLDAVYGVTKAMGEAQALAGRIHNVPLLILYGKHDEIIPREAVRRLIADLHAPYRFVLYPHGWHMLLRDLEAKTVWRDVAHWIGDRRAALPSGDEVPRSQIAKALGGTG